MRVGLDVFTIRNITTDPVEQLRFAKENDLDGVQYNVIELLSPTLDIGEVGDIKSLADSMNLYVELGGVWVNPHRWKAPVEDSIETIKKKIRVCRSLGQNQIHALLGDPSDRACVSPPWGEQVEDSTALVRRIAPVLRDNGVRLVIENHGDVTTAELVRFVEDAGDDIVGICLDIGNLFLYAEDPVAAARRVAPFVGMTHAKDAVVYFVDDGLARQVRPAGSGSTPWEQVISVLAVHAPNLNLSIEDHREYPHLPDGPEHRLVPIYDEQWWNGIPDARPSELASLVHAARTADAGIRSGEIEPPSAYAGSWETRGVARLRRASTHLKAVLARLNLYEGSSP